MYILIYQNHYKVWDFEYTFWTMEKKYKPTYNNRKFLLQQPDKSHFTNCSGQAKQNFVSHLPQLVGNN